MKQVPYRAAFPTCFYETFKVYKSYYSFIMRGLLGHFMPGFHAQRCSRQPCSVYTRFVCTFHNLWKLTWKLLLQHFKYISIHSKIFEPFKVADKLCQFHSSLYSLLNQKHCTLVSYLCSITTSSHTCSCNMHYIGELHKLQFVGTNIVHPVPTWT